MRPCLQAVMLDSTDVNLWYKIGHVALRLIRVPLARHAFEEGLRCNPDHWPCLDNLITVLYTLSDYTSEWGMTESSCEHLGREGSLAELGAGADVEGLSAQRSGETEVCLLPQHALLAFFISGGLPLALW